MNGGREGGREGGSERARELCVRELCERASERAVCVFVCVRARLVPHDVHELVLRQPVPRRPPALPVRPRLRLRLPRVGAGGGGGGGGGGTAQRLGDGEEIRVGEPDGRAEGLQREEEQTDKQ